MMRITDTGRLSQAEINSSGFTDGDPKRGIEATRLKADWFRHVEGELASILADANIALDPSRTDQISDFLKTKFNGFTWVPALDAGSPTLAPGCYGSSSAINTPTSSGILLQAAPINQSQTGMQIWIASNTVDLYFRVRAVVIGALTWSSWNRVWGATNNIFFKAENGYQIFPNGLYMQWGIASGANNSTLDGTKESQFRNYTFPVPFPNYCLSMTCGIYCDSETETGRDGQVWVTNKSRTGFSIGWAEGNGYIPPNKTVNEYVVQTMRASWVAFGH